MRNVYLFVAGHEHGLRPTPQNEPQLRGLSDHVKQLTDKRQAPVERKPDTLPDFPLALVR